MMLENFIVDRMIMGGELPRIALAVLGTVLASWYDLTNNRNVPNRLLYAFLGVAFAACVLFSNPSLQLLAYESIAVAAIVIFTFYYGHDRKMRERVKNALGKIGIGESDSQAFALMLVMLGSLLFHQQGIFVYTISIAAIILAIGYIFYRMGYIGGADVYVLTSIALLVPVVPSWVAALFNFPVVLSVIITSGVLFAIYFLVFVVLNAVRKGARGRYEYLLLLPAYLVLIYFISASGLFGIAYVVTISVLVLSSIVFLVYKEAMTAAMARKIPLSKAEEEDVAVLELMPELAKKYGIKRLLDANELARLRKLKVKELYVYTELPPFLPFVLLGLLVSVSVGDLLMYSMRI
ncbi:Uncharacterised protein [uncultured archaeon]|nr:Uncharacterised protein [uncultured archaeon]